MGVEDTYDPPAAQTGFSSVDMGEEGVNTRQAEQQGPPETCATPDEPKKYGGLTLAGWAKVAVLVALIAAILVAIFVLDLGDKFSDILDWMRSNKVAGFFIFVGLYLLATVLFIPGLILSVGSGFVFGLPLGTLAVWVGATIGQTLAFLLGRYMFRDFFYAWTKKFEKWQAIEGMVEEEGWKIVGLLRLAPLVPYNALNYILGLTSVKFLQYFLTSAFAILPGTLLYVWLGSQAKNIEEISSGDAVDPTVFIVTAAVTGVVIVVVVVMTTVYAKRAISKRLNPQVEKTLPESIEGPDSSKVVGQENV